MNDGWRKMAHVGGTNTEELFRGPDGRVISVLLSKGTTMNQAARIAYRKWKAGK